MHPFRLALPFLLPLALFAQTPASIVQAEFDGPAYASGTTMGGPNLMVALKTQATALFAVTRIEVFTGIQHGTNAVAIWSHDPVNNRPLQMLGTGSWEMSYVRGWQGATITPPVVLNQGQDLWVVWSCINGSQSSLVGPGAGGQQYRPSFDGGLTWGGPYQGNQWKLRLWTGSNVGSYQTFGTGCATSQRGTPELGFDGIPLTGASFDVLLGRGLPGGAAFLGIGMSQSTWQGLPLPLSLGTYGGGNCNVLASVATQALALADANGDARVTWSLPNNPVLVGLSFYDQWWLLDAAANSLGLVVSNGGAGSIGY